MKKLLILLLVLILMFGCNIKRYYRRCGGLEKTTLTIRNSTYRTFYSVHWNGVNFKDIKGMSKVTKAVTQGIGSLHLRFTYAGDYHTTDVYITVDDGQNITFTISSKTWLWNFIGGKSQMGISPKRKQKWYIKF